MEDCKNKIQKKKLKTKTKKNVGKWTRSQHQKFMDLIEKYGRNWVKFQQKIKTRTAQQIRSHAQKVFMLMSKQDMDAFIGSSQESIKSEKKFKKYEKQFRKQKQTQQIKQEKQREEQIQIKNEEKSIEEVNIYCKQQYLQPEKELKYAVVKEINPLPIENITRNQQVYRRMLIIALQERQRLLAEILTLAKIMPGFLQFN